MSRAIKTESGFHPDEGYGFMATAEKLGWRSISSWGVYGWDLGSWPYVAYLFREVDDTFERACYVEGDVTIETYATAADRDADTDEAAVFYWHGERWADGLEQNTSAERIPEHLRGPYSSARADEFNRRKATEAGFTWNGQDATFLELGLGVGDEVWSSYDECATVTELEGEPGTNGHVYRTVTPGGKPATYGVNGRPAAFRRGES